ncbi:glutaredoxin-related protein 5, mitochondrial isoform X2 [Sciurus carolinensis]|uniref:glutaredoxin-related protein 5, mitochondrial isoform X2 n=1 Tax=Sciurus carolinensis TaxID=30640 RepID=UPI001FB46C0D|nr:glutaredoxin-related protein 5, mitochondrial isoform X2 [Sciurus carolinensis]
MSGSLGRAAAALLRWGRGAGGGGLRGAGVRAAGSGGGGRAEQLDTLVKKDKVVVFLKGTPEQPQCGFSNAVVQILRLHGVRDYAAYNVLDDPELRQVTHEDRAAPPSSGLQSAAFSFVAVGCRPRELGPPLQSSPSEVISSALEGEG